MDGFNVYSNAQNIVIGLQHRGQRIDNYLFKILKGVPRSHVHRIIRSGEVRLNSRRIKSLTRLSENDRLRIPPIRTSKIRTPIQNEISIETIFEDESCLVVDKPTELAVHGISGPADNLQFGLIEILRKNYKYLELLHRLDKATSGLIVLAKNRDFMLNFSDQLKNHKVRKTYQAIVHGNFPKLKRIDLPIKKIQTKDGHHCEVSKNGKNALTLIEKSEYLPDHNVSILDIVLVTGRTHQIRVHLSHLGHPILGDDKYTKTQLHKRMMLHARSLAFEHKGKKLNLNSKLNLSDYLQDAG